MSKKIAVQKDLYNIKTQLFDLGYEVSDIEENESVEAIVYIADGYNIPYNNQMINMADGEEMVENPGAILINASGKTVEDINNIITHRKYSSLFE